MLGRLEMDVDKCIEAYGELAKEVFGERLSSIPFSFTGKVKSRFDSLKLENAIGKIVRKNGASADDLFNDDKDRGCRT